MNRAILILFTVLGVLSGNAHVAQSALKPIIFSQPRDITVVAPAKAVFIVIASDIPLPKYQWMQRINGGAFTAIAGATKNMYTIESTSATDNGTRYECVLSSGTATVISNAASLTVYTKPSITTQPASATVKVSATATFQVAASGTPNPTYQWRSKSPKAAFFMPIGGANKPSYTTGAIVLSNSGTQYECVVTNAAGSVTSNATTLTVQPAGITPAVSFTITASADSNSTISPSGTVGVNSGSSQTFTMTANSGYQISQVLVDGTVITPVPSSYTFTNVTANHTIAESSSQIVYTVSTSVTGSGNLMCRNGPNVCSSTGPAGISVPAGTMLTFIATPYSGSPTVGSNYGVWGGACASVGSDSNNCQITVNSNVSVVANFTTNYSVFLSIQSTGNSSGTLSDNQGDNCSGSGCVIHANAGAQITFTATPASESIFGGWGEACTGVGTTSSPYTCTITVNGITSVSYNTYQLVPAVTIISPANSMMLTTSSLNITATAAENGGTISNVSFYNGTILLGTVTSTSQAFTYTWTNIPAGVYNLTAVAIDLNGVQITSTPVTITINAANSTTAIDDNIASKTDALNNTTSYQYDNDNRLLKTTFADNSTVSYAYDFFGNQTSVTDQRNNTLIKTYDAYERLSQIQDPLKGVTQFSYDTNGNLLTLTDANNNATSYTYDQDNRVLTQTNALNDATTFTYDLNGNIATRVDANGSTTKYTHDALNRLWEIFYPNNTSVTYQYDNLGRKSYMKDSTGEIFYTYDALNRLLTKTVPGTNTKITHTYDGEGNRLTTVDPDSRTITNTYDALNRLSMVQDQNGTTAYGYDADSNKTFIELPNGLTESYTYDSLNRVLTAETQKVSIVISSYANTYDIAGMIIKKAFVDGSWTTYSYDFLNRLLEETKQNNGGIIYDYVYTYDPVGNRLTWTKNTTLGGFWSTDYLNIPPMTLSNMTNGGYGNTANPTQAVNLTRTYTYDAANRLSNWKYAINIYSAFFPVQMDIYNYDNNGNRLSKEVAMILGEPVPQETTYAYDFENRLNQVQYNNVPNVTGTDSFTYNADGSRVQASFNSVISNYLYDGSNILLEQNSSNTTTKSYTRGLDIGGGIGSLIDQNFTVNNTPMVQYYDYDDLGSTSDVRLPTGVAADSYSYDAYGNLLAPQNSSDTNRYLFSTKEFDSRSGLYYFGARYYDPEIGRWLTPDPLGFVNGPNPYLYVNDNPINLVDPLGLWYVNIGVNYALGVQGEGGVIISDKGIYTYTGGGGGTPGAGANITVSPDEPSLGWSSGYQGGFFFGGAYGQTQYKDGSTSNYWEIGLVTPGFSVTSNYVQPYYQWPWISNQTGNTTNQLPAVTNSPDELPNYSNLEAPDLAGKERVE